MSRNVTAQFSVGERVRVLKAYPLGHVRTPYYIRGRTGEVERICGNFPNPEIALELGVIDTSAEVINIAHCVTPYSSVLWVILMRVGETANTSTATPSASMRR